MPQCKAQTRARKQCSSKAVEGIDRCKRHAPKAEEESLGPNASAIVTTLRALGRMEDVDAARWQMLLSLAQAVDAAPTRAALWEQYREALSELMKEVADADRGLEEAAEALRLASEAEVGHSAKR